MKKIICVFAIAMIYINCKQENPVDYAVISGNILNKEGGELGIYKTDNSFSDTLKIAENGSFRDTLKIKAGHYYFVEDKNFSTIYIDQGTNITINFDSNNFDSTLTFSGVGGEINNYLFEKGKAERKNIMGAEANAYVLGEADFKAKLIELKNDMNDLLSSTEGIPEVFKIKEKRNLDYEYMKKMKDFEMYHARFAGVPDFKVSEAFLSNLNKITYNNEEDILFSDSYKNMVSNYYVKEALKLDSIPNEIAFIEIVDTITNKTIKNTLLFDYVKSNMLFTKKLKEFYAAFMNASTSEADKKEITLIYNKIKTTFKGEPSPKFINYENHAGGTTSLDDLRGHYVYIDIWATWCGPCKKEIPFLKELEKKYEGKNVEFVSISVDTKGAYDAWRKMVTDMELTGVQLFADDNFNSSFIKAYSINAIPRFILIDPNGNIVDANAARPSQKELIDQFNELGI